MSGHTPGPWEREGLYLFVDDRVRVCCGRGRNECCGDPDIEGDRRLIAAVELETDVPIIATAPTMLSAIEQFEAWWQEVGQVSFNGAPACVFALREAAAKARGGA